MRRSILPFAAAILALTLTRSAGATDALGFNVHQSAGVGLDATRDASLGWVRVDVNWLGIEAQQGTFDFSVVDAVVDGANTRGLKVLAVLAYGPAWASSGDTKGDGPNNDVPNAGTYASFVTAAVTHLAAKGVTHYEMWNEPNLGQFWEGTAQSYVDRVLVPGADAVHAACSSCQVLGPAIATVGTTYGSFLDTVLGSAQAKIDIVSGHAYAPFPDGTSSGPGVTSDSFFNKLESHRVISVGGVPVYTGPLSFREVMDQHGVTKPFWLTETGKTAHLGNATEEQAQLVYCRRVLESMLSRPWWQGTIFYEAFDDPNDPSKWGAVVEDGAAAKGYQPKAVMGLLAKAASSNPLFGGNKTECDDGLDDDLDGQIDYPNDTTCTSLASASEGVAPPPGQGANGGTADAGATAGTDAGAAGEADASGGATGDGASTHSDGGCSVGLTAGADDPSSLVVGASVLGLLAARRRNRRVK